jgi:hypothetical protein
VRSVLICVAVIASTGIVAAAPCPSEAALVEVARKAFPLELRDPGGGAVSIEPTTLACTAVRGHAATQWLVTMTVGSGQLLALVAGNDVTWRCCQLVAGTPSLETELVRLADLDGDRVDEIVLKETYTSHERYHRETLLVRDLDGHAAGIELSRGSPFDGWACSSTWRLVPGPRKTQLLELTGTCTATPPDDYPIGRHVYTFRAGELVETKG